MQPELPTTCTLHNHNHHHHHRSHQDHRDHHHHHHKWWGDNLKMQRADKATSSCASLHHRAKRVNHVPDIEDHDDDDEDHDHDHNHDDREVVLDHSWFGGSGDKYDCLDADHH